MALTNLDEFAIWLMTHVEKATDDGNFLIAGYAYPPNDATGLALMVTSRRFFGEIGRLFSEEYPAQVLSLGRPLDPNQLDRLVSLHRGLRIHSLQWKEPLSDKKMAIGAILADMSPAHWYARGFFLLDICEFSLRSAADQMSLRLLLDAAIRKARVSLLHNWKQAHDEAEFNLIPTGDGFYIWHKRPSRHADSIVLALGALTLGELQRQRWKGNDLQVRAAMTIGEVYTFPCRPVGAAAREPVLYHDAIGPALNVAARLCSGAAPGQLLLADFSSTRLGDKDQIRTAADLVLSATTLIGADDFALQIKPDHRFKVVDKHGEPHYCFNVSGKVFFYTGPTRRSTTVGVVPDATPLLDPKSFSPNQTEPDNEAR